MASSGQETIPSEQDWIGKEMAFSPTSTTQQKALRLCFIPNWRIKLAFKQAANLCKEIITANETHPLTHTNTQNGMLYRKASRRH